jgi:hypothetical protein
LRAKTFILQYEPLPLGVRRARIGLSFGDCRRAFGNQFALFEHAFDTGAISTGDHAPTVSPVVLKFAVVAFASGGNVRPSTLPFPIPIVTLIAIATSSSHQASALKHA